MPFIFILSSCSAVALFALSLANITAEPSRVGQQPSPASIPETPPISWTCPMHPEVVDSEKATCPICKMDLVPVRLDTIWTCPVHAVIAERKPGLCRIDRRELVAVTVSVSWTCRARPEIDEVTPGKCPDGTAMVVKHTPRPHGDHNPQHGGQFFMAPDNWHHLEGTYAQHRQAQIFLYDDYSKPLPYDKVKLAKGRMVTKETFDPATQTTKEIAFPLVMEPGGRYLQAQVDTNSLPAKLTAKLKLREDGPEYRFDFEFSELTIDPAPAPAGSSSPSQAAAAQAPRKAPVDTPASSAAAPPSSAPPPASSPEPPSIDSMPTDPGAGVVDPNLIEVAVPETLEEKIAQLKTRSAEIREFIDKGAFGNIYVPAFQAKDLAVALEGHNDRVPADSRPAAEAALRRLVRTAWLLDAFGDLGNRQQIEDAYAMFAAAVAEVEALFPTTAGR